MQRLFSFWLLLLLALPAGAAALQDSLIPLSTQKVDGPIVIHSTEREFSPGYQENYKSPEFIYERKESTEKMSIWQEFLRWISDGLFSDSYGEGGSLSMGTILKRAGAVLIILIVIYFIVRALLKKEGYWIFDKAKKNISAKDILTDNIEVTDFQALIETTKQSGDYRLGIRYYYLWLLKLLAYNSVIKWHKDKTNNDYLYEIKDDALRGQYKYLSYIYDYSWYGEFPINENDYTKAEKAFLETINRLKR